MSKTVYRPVHGFTLIEVLVSMVILAIGLLGLGLMEGRALKSNKDAYLYAQANFLAYEMADRIKANWAFWGLQSTGNANGCTNICAVPTAAIPSGQTSANACSNTVASGKLVCTPAQLAAYDMYYWQQSVAAMLGNGVTTPTTQIYRVTAANENDACPLTDQTSLCLVISWPRSDTSVSGTAASQALGVPTATQTLGVTP